MTREQLDAIRARHAETTRKNWGFEMDDSDPSRQFLLFGPYSLQADMQLCRADASFVYHAHNDVAALLAEVERLQAEVYLYIPIVANAEVLKAGYQRETERLRKLLADAGESARKARVENKFLRERNRRDEAVSLLAEQEWITDGRECLVYCIHCGKPESKGHDEYCRAFGREGIVTGCLEEKAELTARFEALMDEIDAATKVTP